LSIKLKFVAATQRIAIQRENTAGTLSKTLWFARNLFLSF